jgi:hypothetical protein
VIPRNIEIIGQGCSHSCQSLKSISFESDSQLKRIDSQAFSSSSLQSIVVPRSVEYLASSCFELCQSL